MKNGKEFPKGLNIEVKIGSRPLPFDPTPNKEAFFIPLMDKAFPLAFERVGQVSIRIISKRNNFKIQDLENCNWEARCCIRNEREIKNLIADDEVLKLPNWKWVRGGSKSWVQETPPPLIGIIRRAISKSKATTEAGELIAYGADPGIRWEAKLNADGNPD